jgi:hypothetical protein
VRAGGGVTAPHAQRRPRFDLRYVGLTAAGGDSAAAATAVQVVLNRHLRWTLGLRPGTATWSMLAELDMQPLQYSWWTQVVRFFNAAVEPAMERASPLMAAALKADMSLAAQPGGEAQRTWSGRLLQALGQLGDGEHFQQLARSLRELPVEEVLAQVELAYARLWSTDEPGTEQPGAQPRDPRHPQEAHPAHARYNSWFRPTAGVVMQESRRHTSSSANKRTHDNLRWRLGDIRVQPCSHCGEAEDGSQPLADELHICFECAWYEQQLRERGLPGRPAEAGDFTQLYEMHPRREAFRFVQAVAGLAPQ